MGLSVKNAWSFVFDPSQEQLPVTIFLSNGRLETKNGRSDLIDLDQWPVFLFLRAVGFDRILLNTSSPDVFEAWLSRMTGYEQIFIQDPENLVQEECQWNEWTPDKNLLIECLRAKSNERTEESSIRSLPPTRFFVPPLEAPIGIPPDAARLFVQEVHRQSPQETIRRIQFILREYQMYQASTSSSLSPIMVADIISMALEQKMLDAAVQMAAEYRDLLKQVWDHPETALRLFAAYDPKVGDLLTWSQIFEPCSIFRLIHLLEHYLSTDAGPQLVRLMNLRAQHETDEVVDICLSSHTELQRLLLQWLAPHWKSKHYPQIFEAFEKSLSAKPPVEFIRLWITALLQSARKTALEDLERFLNRGPFWTFKKKISSDLQRNILDAVAENRSPEVHEFLLRIRKKVSSDIAHRVDFWLNTNRSGVKA